MSGRDYHGLHGLAGVDGAGQDGKAVCVAVEQFAGEAVPLLAVVLAVVLVEVEQLLDVGAHEPGDEDEDPGAAGWP
jgi:hypothetical protein